MIYTERMAMPLLCKSLKASIHKTATLSSLQDCLQFKLVSLKLSSLSNYVIMASAQTMHTARPGTYELSLSFLISLGICNATYQFGSFPFTKDNILAEANIYYIQTRS